MTAFLTLTVNFIYATIKTVNFRDVNKHSVRNVNIAYRDIY